MIKRLLPAALAVLCAVPLFSDEIFYDDVVIQQSLGVGMDVNNGENFGFSTILLKENNLRITFEDTSNSGSFPTNDWQLTANESTNGGKNRFSIEDLTAGQVPFTVSAGAPDHALYVHNNGNLGIRSDAPAQDVHITSDDSPTLRLEQSADAGLPTRSWDLVGNEAGLTVRDVTAGGAVPFQIEPDAPQDSLVLGVNGIGLGVGTATARLHVRETADAPAALIENTHATEGDRTVLRLKNKGPAGLKISNTTTAGTASEWEVVATDAGTLIIRSGGSQVFELDASGNLTVTGALSDSSDRGRKENLAPVDASNVLERLSSVPMTTWNYTGDTAVHIGPMAQDFHKAFSVGGSAKAISKVDADGVALASIQALHRDAEAKDEEIAELKRANRELEKRLKRLESKLETL